MADTHDVVRDVARALRAAGHDARANGTTLTLRTKGGEVHYGTFVKVRH